MTSSNITSRDGEESLGQELVEKKGSKWSLLVPLIALLDESGTFEYSCYRGCDGRITGRVVVE